MTFRPWIHLAIALAGLGVVDTVRGQSGEAPMGLRKKTPAAPVATDGEAKSTAPLPATQPTGARPADPLDEQLQKELGEDLGAKSESPLVEISQRMKQVGDRLAGRESGADTQQEQARIVNDLDQLLKQLAQQAKKSPRDSKNPKSPSGKSTPSQSPGDAAAANNNGKRSSQPAKDSTDKLGTDKLRQPDISAMNDAHKAVWGNLPAREREQMLQNAQVEFLPKYGLLIEEYFKSLSRIKRR